MSIYRAKVEDILEHKYFDIFLIILILINILLIILDSIEALHSQYKTVFYIINFVSVIFFTIEYILRVFCLKHIKFILHPLLILDLLAILPFFVGIAFHGTVAFRLFRLFRLVRILKVARYLRALISLKSIFIRKKEELLITVFFFLAVLIIASTLMYQIEGDLQKGFSSIPHAMWWCVVTFTTVGYGDVVPTTVMGKLIAAIVSLSGITLYSVMSSILGSALYEEINKFKN